MLQLHLVTIHETPKDWTKTTIWTDAPWNDHLSANIICPPVRQMWFSGLFVSPRLNKPNIGPKQPFGLMAYGMSRYHVSSSSSIYTFCPPVRELCFSVFFFPSYMNFPETPYHRTCKATLRLCQRGSESLRSFFIFWYLVLTSQYMCCCTIICVMCDKQTQPQNPGREKVHERNCGGRWNKGQGYGYQEY